MNAQPLHTLSEEICKPLRTAQLSTVTLAPMSPRQRAPRSDTSLGRGELTHDNALTRLIRNRMQDLDYTFHDVARAGGFPSHSTVSQIMYREMKMSPRPETLRKLAKALQVPLDVVKVAAAQAAGIQHSEITTTLDAADDTRIVVAHMQELTDEQRREIARYVTQRAIEIRQEAAADAAEQA